MGITGTPSGSHLAGEAGIPSDTRPALGSTAARETSKPRHAHEQSSRLGHPRSSWAATMRIGVVAAMAVSLVLLAFLWPTRTSTVRDLLVDVVGSDQVATKVTEGLTGSGAFAVDTSTANRADAVARIERRESYGAIVVDGSTIEVLTAPAASPAAAQVLQGAAAKLAQSAGAEVASAKGAAAQQAAQLGAQAAAAQASAATLAQVAQQTPAGPAKAALATQAQQAQQKASTAAAAAAKAKGAVEAIAAPQVTTTEVVSLAPDDPRGAGLGVAALPLAMGGMIGGVLISLMVTGWGRRLAAAAAYPVLAGLLLTLILDTWTGVLPGHFLGLWGVLTAALFATAAVIVGFESVFGRIGIALGAIITMFLGNPLSAASAPMEFLPWHWGAIGQSLVPGAAATLMKDVVYFPEAATLRPWLVVAAWSLLGVLCAMLGRHRFEEVVHTEDVVEG